MNLVCDAHTPLPRLIPALYTPYPDSLPVSQRPLFQFVIASTWLGIRSTCTSERAKEGKPAVINAFRMQRMEINKNKK